jgi:DNA-directed RNA polymerase specialized sigma subunit
MDAKKLKAPLSYSALYNQISLIQDQLKKQKKSPTIAELSAIIGDTEEHILESMELGKPNSTLIH